MTEFRFDGGTHAERILQTLGLLPNGASDAELSRRLGTRHQTINATCRKLATRGLIARERRGGLIIDQSIAHAGPERVARSSVGRPWFWEGNVQATVVDTLGRAGWTIVRTSNTETHEPGKDIEATSGESRLWITVKGKPVAHPGAQARLWFADALFDVIRYRQEDASVSLAVALPEYEKYDTWRERTVWLMRAAPFDYLWVSEEGAVRYDPGREPIL